MIYIVGSSKKNYDRLTDLLKSAQIAYKHYEFHENFINEYHSSLPSCIIVEMSISDSLGIRSLDVVLALKTCDPVIVVTDFADFDYAIDIMKHGVFDCFDTNFKPLNMLRSIQKALHESALRHSREEKIRNLSDRLSRLSCKEREVLKLHLMKLSSKEIAIRLNIASATVDNYKSKIIQKASLQSIIDMADAYCILGLCSDKDACKDSFT